MSEYVAEVKMALDGMIEAFEEFRNDHHQRLQEHQRAIEAIEVRMNRPGLTAGPSQFNSVEGKAWVSFIRRGVERMEDQAEVKSLNVGSDPNGGYVAPKEFIREVLKAVVEYSPIRQAARVGQTSAGSVLLPKRTGRPTAYWTGELEARKETASSYGLDEIPVNEQACFVDISQRLLEDAAIDIAAEVAFDLAEEFGRAEGEAFVKGDGIRKPLGFLNASGVTAYPNGHVSVLSSDSLIKMLYSLPAYYRNRGAWVMNGSTLATVRTLREEAAAGAYLWQPGIALGQPETLLGRPVIEAVNMPDIATNAFSIAYADWGVAYRIYDKANGFTLLRDPYSQATNGLVRFHARRRVGGQVVLPQAIRVLKMSVS